jgi:hypothetical protein
MANWSFLTNHARVLLYIAHDPGARLRDIAASQGITERSAHAIVADLSQAGYVVKQKEGRRNRYQIEAHLPLAEPGTREPAVGEVLALLLGERTAENQPDGADGTPPGSAVRASAAGSRADGHVLKDRGRSSPGRRSAAGTAGVTDVEAGLSRTARALDG